MKGSAASSWFATLNPVTSLAIGLVLLIPLVITIDWLSASIVLGCELLACGLAGIRPAWLGRRLLPLAFLAPLAALSMLLYGKAGGRVLWHWGPILISDQSVRLAIAVVIRIVALALPAIVLSSAMDPTKLADGLTQKLKLPSRFVLGTLAGVRTMSLLSQDWASLGQARRARGLGEGGRLKRLFSMAFGLLVFAVRRGTVLATAMEARGFGGSVRTHARTSDWHRRDLVAVLIAVAIAAAALVAAFSLGTSWVA